MRIDQISSRSCPVFSLSLDSQDHRLFPQDFVREFVGELTRQPQFEDPASWPFRWRATTFSEEKLTRFLENGHDSISPYSGFYAASFDKAWEYIRYPGLMVGYRLDGLQSGIRVVDAHELSDERRRALEAEYPDIATSPDGRTILFSKIYNFTPHVGFATRLAYESQYGFCTKHGPRSISCILVISSE